MNLLQCFFKHLPCAAAFVLGMGWATGHAQTQLLPTTAQAAEALQGAPAGPVRLRQLPPPLFGTSDDISVAQALPRVSVPPPAYVPGEFERFVQQQTGSDVQVRRFGWDLMSAEADNGTAELNPLVPADYLVAPGDEVLVTLWGSVDADLRLTVDRSGRITIPRVGTVQVAGVKHADLPTVVEKRVAQVFRNFELSVTLGQLRGIRVFVTGFVQKPGAYTVTSLSTVVAALMRAGGPSAAGSFRKVELRRGNKVLSQFDLYDLLLRGDRSADRIVQAGDVVHVGPVGTQVGFIGSVNKPAVLELKPGEGVADALRMVGGFVAVADRSRLAVERLQDRNSGRVVQLQLPQDEKQALGDGDVLRAFSAVTAILPTQRQAKRVTVEGEVLRPAEYVLPEGSSIRDAIRAAGGLAGAAYPYAAEFTRVSVQRTQQENYERALRDLETDFARAAGSQRVATTEDAATLQARSAGTTRLIERLRALRPSGRIVLQMAPNATELPDLALEDGDRIYIPARPSTVGVFGSVFNAASYLHQPGRTVDDYLRLAGGPTKGADEGSVFLIRANGDVVSARQSAGWFNQAGEIRRMPSQPGDTVFVPEEMNKTTFAQSAREWTQIFSQFGLGLAAIKVLGN
ncbi:SLBB domain-containing protein [Ralstonia sp.]|uniref:polysaccharide biosynthesis/export family protein n=1 Tax=Ralstonia sp. TaxID=54061 RepID=UPI00257B5A19|nr:SLBB domain-containing protein [Ralstonia sp.]MBA4281084.1 sugar ABC transporter substrate-binding protein [Ralstonia sp.]